MWSVWRHDIDRRGGQAAAVSSSRRGYPSDLTDAQWALIEPLLPELATEGRREKHPRREVVNGILYVVRSGCPWRYLPGGSAASADGVLVLHPLGAGRRHSGPAGRVAGRSPRGAGSRTGAVGRAHRLPERQRRRHSRSGHARLRRREEGIRCGSAVKQRQVVVGLGAVWKATLSLKVRQLLRQ